MSRFLATNKQEISEREIKNMKCVRKLASQGMTLLENEKGVLPLSKNTKKVALYGNGARRTVKGGIGSGDVNTRLVVNIECGFENAGYEVTSKNWLDKYDNILSEAKQVYAMNAGQKISSGSDPIEVLFKNPFQEPEIPRISKEDIHNSDTDTCVYVISRNSGEGADRYNVEGDYKLSQKEVENLTLLGLSYDKVIVILNIGGVIDTKKFRSIEGIGAVLLMSQAGSMGGDAVVDVISGKVTPSGKLAATWAEDYTDYPSSKEFSHNNGNLDDAYYIEGIYVGYRYFDTFNVTPAYCFGYGKSYTTFKIQTEFVTADESEITVTVKVTNTGSEFSGKEVVQIYYAAPSGKLEKPYQELAAFAKTSELMPGESQMMSISFKTRCMASYSEKDAAWILEAGKYFIRVGNSSRNTKETEKLKNLLNLDEKFDELSSSEAVSYSYQEEEREKENAPVYKINIKDIETFYAKYQDSHQIIPINENKEKITLRNIIDNKASLDELIGQLTINEMATLCVGKVNEEFDVTSMIGIASSTVPGAAGETASIMKDDRDINSIVMADGPAGLRLVPEFGEDTEGKAIFDQISMMRSIAEIFGNTPHTSMDGLKMHYQYCTAIPIATLLAQTWDYDVIKQCGDIVGEEMEEFGITLWLAPGMNIQRNPLCGRNFEYYSEDPLLSGICATADTDGIQQHSGLGTTIKHFAANNQEDNRNFCNSHVSERALREIYLKGFEIAVKEAQPLSIMSSYNLLNGIHTANHYDLLTSVARDEWGFEGIVMTDWSTTNLEEGKMYPCSSPVMCIKAGNDLIMPGRLEDINDIVTSVNNDGAFCPLTLGDLQFCVKNILKLLIRIYR